MMLCIEADCRMAAKRVDVPFMLYGVAGPDGKKVKVWFQKYECLDGHGYMVEVFEEPGNF